MRRSSTALIVVGLCLAIGGVLWQFGLLPGSQTSLPPPVAMGIATAEPKVPVPATPTLPPPPPTALPTPTRVTVPVSTEIPTPVAVPVSTPAPIHVVVADAADRAAQIPQTEPNTGYAARLVIPSISLDTPVVQGGIVADIHGNSIWQTLPFVAVHYGDLTALIGAPGNAVISGHVVTIDEGNVFRFLYKVGIDDLIQVWDDQEREYDYHVVEVKLVPPSDVSVMEPTPDQTLTLITCGGTFDRIHAEFSARLIVTAKPAPPE